MEDDGLRWGSGSENEMVWEGETKEAKRRGEGKCRGEGRRRMIKATI